MPKVGDLTVQDLKEIIRETVIEMFADPDEGKELRPEFAERLRAAMESRRRGRARPIEEFADEIGEEW